MSLLISFLPILLLIGLTLGFVKLAARVLHRTQVSSKQALMFALMLVTFLVAKGFALYVGLIGDGLSLVLEPLIGGAVVLALGTWYFGTRARTAAGELLRWPGGLKLTGLVLALMLAFSLGTFTLLLPLLPK